MKHKPLINPDNSAEVVNGDEAVMAHADYPYYVSALLVELMRQTGRNYFEINASESARQGPADLEVRVGVRTEGKDKFFAIELIGGDE